MVDKLLEFSLRRPLLILTFAGLLTLLGGYAFRTISIDAFPDVTSVLVQIVNQSFKNLKTILEKKNKL